MVSLPVTAKSIGLNRRARRLLSSSIKQFGTVAAVGLLLSACSNPSTTALGTNVPLAPAPDLVGSAPPGAVVWRAPDLAKHERAASAYLIPPATVYQGKGASFGGLKPPQVEAIASELTKQVRTEIGRHFKVVKEAGPGVFTLELVLVKVIPPRQEYVTSGPFSISALAVGMPDAGGTTTGSLTVAGKFLDAQTGKLLVAFSTPVNPTMMDMGASESNESMAGFAEVASEQFATDLVKAIIHQRRSARAMPAK